MAATAVTMSLTGLVLRPVVVAKPRRCSHVTRASTSTSLSTIAFARLGRVGLAGACRANVTPKGLASTRGSDTRQRAARPGASQRKDGHTEQTASGLESSPDDRSRDASAETPPQGGVSIFFKPITERALPAGLALGGAGVFGSGLQLDGPASTAEAIVVLASIIFVHECGHFFAARSQNIHVSKFSVGFGPSLLSYQGPEVEYSLRLIPLGGFVAFPDDDPDCPYPEDDPDLLRNRPTKDRAIVVSAGVAANVVFALSILLVQVNTVGLVTQTYAPGVRVTNLTQTSAAREYGVLQGDVITKVNGRVLTPDRASVAVDFFQTHHRARAPRRPRLGRRRGFWQRLATGRPRVNRGSDSGARFHHFRARVRAFLRRALAEHPRFKVFRRLRPESSFLPRPRGGVLVAFNPARRLRGVSG